MNGIQFFFDFLSFFITLNTQFFYLLTFSWKNPILYMILKGEKSFDLMNESLKILFL